MNFLLLHDRPVGKHINKRPDHHFWAKPLDGNPAFCIEFGNPAIPIVWTRGFPPHNYSWFGFIESVADVAIVIPIFYNFISY